MKTGDLFIAALIMLGIAGATAGIFFAAPQPAVLFSTETPSASGAIAFDSFGPAHTFGTNCWAVGGSAHADWFIPAQSGSLSAIELALEPPARNAGDATVILAGDKRGSPGQTMESFTVTADMGTSTSNAAPIVVHSVTQPMLEAGVKYWLYVRGSGPWTWHFNNQNIAQNARRETKRGKWASAGDYCYVCAFRVMISPNPEPDQPAN